MPVGTYGTVKSLTPEELRSKTDQGDILWDFCLWTSNVKAIRTISIFQNMFLISNNIRTVSLKKRDLQEIYVCEMLRVEI